MTILLEHIKKAIIEMQSYDEFSLEDYTELAKYVDIFRRIAEKELKPHVVIWNMNLPDYLYQFIHNTMDIIGYEAVGNMEHASGKYNFESKDEHHETLFRFKDKNCDYSITFEIDTEGIMSNGKLQSY